MPIAIDTSNLTIGSNVKVVAHTDGQVYEILKGIETNKEDTMTNAMYV